MKVIKNVFKLLKANKKIVIIFNIQLFLVLFFTVTSINEYRESIKIYNKGLNSKLKYAIYYMGKPAYGIEKDDRKINNNEEVIKAKRLFERFYYDNIEYFDGRLESKDSADIIDENGQDEEIRLLDRNTMEIVLNNRINTDLTSKSTETNIPVLVNDKYKKDYKLNDKIQFQSVNGVNLTLQVIDYFDSDKSFDLTMEVMGNSAPNLSEILSSMNKSYDYKFLALQEGDYLKNLEVIKYTFGEPASMILYVKKEHFDHIVDKLDAFSKKNDIGYYSLMKDSIGLEKERINIQRLKFLDFTIALYFIIILTIIAIGYINSRILRKRYKIYHLNGASRYKLYLTTLFYYLAQFFVAVILYTIFIKFAKSDFVRHYLSESFFFTMIRQGKFDIDLFVSVIMTVFVIIISVIISYLPLIKLKERRRNL